MRGIRYTSEHLAWLRENYTLTVSELCGLFAQKFGITPSPTGLQYKRRALGLGLRRDGVLTRPIVGNRKKRELKAVGTTILVKGLLYQKVINDGPCRWKAVHRMRWEEANGPIPRGKFLVCKTNRLDTDPSNWVLASPSMSLRLYGANGRLRYSDAPSEMKAALLGLARLEEAMLAIHRGEPVSR